MSDGFSAYDRHDADLIRKRYGSEWSDDRLLVDLWNRLQAAEAALSDDDFSEDEYYNGYYDGYADGYQDGADGSDFEPDGGE